MLAFFPSPYPDELLYSVIARYQLRLGSHNAKSLVAAVFDSSTASAVVDLPSRLNALHLNLPKGTLNTPAKLINDNTLFPYYRRFLSSRRASSIVDMMCDSHDNRIHTSIGISAGSIPQIHRLRYCMECIEDDEKLYGEPYWHRSHQLFGVIRCHRHQNWLIESVLSTPSSGSRRCFKALGEIYLLGGHSLESDLESQSWVDIALSSYWLLNTPSELVHEANTLRRRYLWWLWKKQIVTNPFTLKIRQVSEQLLAYYGEDILRQLHCHFGPSDDHNWVACLLRKQRKMIHPLHHILFMHFLGITPELFFQQKEQPYHPFGRGPWPCLNPTAPHYRERVISECECTHLNERREPVGVFRCDCGYSYGRVKHTEGNDDCYQSEWIVSFGPTWEGELFRLVHQTGLSLRETAKRLEVDVNTVKFQLNRLGEGDISILEQTIDDNVKDDECNLRRDRWLGLLKLFPEKNRKELREQAKSDYAWLYRNDREWFFNHQPEPVARKIAKERINWQERDKELASQISSAVEQLKGLPGLPQRISIAAIDNHLGTRSLLEKKRYKLPNTSIALNSLVDSDDSFISRRVSYAIKTMQTENIPIAAWRILQKAAIRDSPVVQEIIQRHLIALYEL